MTEQITDKDLEIVRETLLSSSAGNYMLRNKYAMQIIARLDAAERRVAELKRKNALLRDMLHEQGEMLSDVMVRHGELPPC